MTYRMDMNMRKETVARTSLLALLILTSCTNADYRREIFVEGAKGRFYETKSGTAIPLTADIDTIEYEYGDRKLRVFKGEAGRSLSLRFDSAQNLLIISYCDGRIAEVESSFVDTLTTQGENWTIYRTQVINNPGFSYAGTSLC